MKKLLGINPLVMVIVSSEYSDGEVMSNFTDYGFKGRLLSRFGWGGWKLSWQKYWIENIVFLRCTCVWSLSHDGSLVKW